MGEFSFLLPDIVRHSPGMSGGPHKLGLAPPDNPRFSTVVGHALNGCGDRLSSLRNLSGVPAQDRRTKRHDAATWQFEVVGPPQLEPQAEQLRNCPCIDAGTMS